MKASTGRQAFGCINHLVLLITQPNGKLLLSEWYHKIFKCRRTLSWSFSENVAKCLYDSLFLFLPPSFFRVELKAKTKEMCSKVMWERVEKFEKSRKIWTIWVLKNEFSSKKVGYGFFFSYLSKLLISNQVVKTWVFDIKVGIKNASSRRWRKLWNNKFLTSK